MNNVYTGNIVFIIIKRNDLSFDYLVYTISTITLFIIPFISDMQRNKPFFTNYHIIPIIFKNIISFKLTDTCIYSNIIRNICKVIFKIFSPTFNVSSDKIIPFEYLHGLEESLL